jgi:hypothetical protein
LDDIEEIRRIRQAKRGDDDAANFVGKAVRRVYRAVPERVWMNDAELDKDTFVRDYRAELSLAALRRHAAKDATILA